jgi:hypothetical protein
MVSPQVQDNNHSNTASTAGVMGKLQHETILGENTINNFITKSGEK